MFKNGYKYIEVFYENTQKMKVIAILYEWSDHTANIFIDKVHWLATFHQVQLQNFI